MDEATFKRNLTTLRIVVLVVACLFSYYVGKLVGYEAGIDHALSSIQRTVQQEVQSEPRILQ